MGSARKGWWTEPALILEKSQTSCAILAVPRHETHGVVDRAARQRMALIVPHVERAVFIGKALDLQSAAGMLTDAFDSLCGRNLSG